MKKKEEALYYMRNENMINDGHEFQTPIKADVMLIHLLKRK